jgi:probable HAF family extracellular repeat protein
MLRHCGIILFGLSLTIAAVGTASATIYHLTDLAPAGADTNSRGLALADVGGVPEVAGLSNNGSVSAPAVWAGGSATSFLSSIPGATFGVAWAINGNGDIAGRATVSGATRGFYLPAGAGTATVLPVLDPAAVYGTATGISNAGQVVGTSKATDGNYHASVWTSGGGLIDLGSFPGGVPSSGSLSAANGISANGKVVGMSYKADGTWDPAMWTYDGSSWTITNLNPTHTVCHAGSSAYTVNQYGDAAGYGFVNGGIDPTTRAVLFKHDGTVVALPGLGAGAPSDRALGINSLGTVVGNATVTGGGYHAFIYDSATGVEQDLNTLIAPDGSGTGWTLQYAYGIDDGGRITGFGPGPSGTTRGFLLTPVLPGDANEDGTVNINDLSKVLTNYDKTGLWADGDFNGDGSINIQDLSNVLTNYDKSIGAAATPGIKAVPEPATLSLWTVGLIALLVSVRLRRR